MIDWSLVRGIIFDNDGVIVNSEPLSCGALRQLFLQEFTVDIGTDYSSVLGTSDRYAIEYFGELHNLRLYEVDELIDRKGQIYFEIAQENLSSFPDFHPLMEQLERRYDLAVASSGNHDKIKFSLESIGASIYFPIICSATEVARGKPYPDLFLYTAECMALQPQSCVVVEDSIKGIQGATAAGMQTIGYTSSFPEEELLEAGATWVISNYEDLINNLP
ncbi:MAG: HAD family hydrolase [Candidatus Kariarchaeaceae archaeon]|jgi:HAD superfamily hydrolase (TIGR01509 family)